MVIDFAKTVHEICHNYDTHAKDISPKNPARSSMRIIYLTNRCNLACTYCYEGLGDTFKYGGMVPAIPKLEQLTEQIDNIVAEEPSENKQTLFILFGGEPLMQWKNMKGFMLYAFSKKKNIRFNTVTNGVLLTKPKFLKDFISFFQEQPEIKQRYSLDISFDGIGNGERIFRGGKKSTPTVLKALSTLSNINKNIMKFDWRIRYTIHSENVKRWREDIFHLVNTFEPWRIVTSIDSELDKRKDYLEIHDILRKNITTLRTLWETKTLKTPICGFFCDTCNLCQGTHDYKYYYTDKGLTKKQLHSENIMPFGSEWGSDYEGRRI